MEYLTLSTLLLTLPLLYILHGLFSLTKNYLRARRTALPILINPVFNLSPLWLLFRPLLTPPLTVLLPAPLTAWIPRTSIGWNQQPKYSTHASLKSDAFWLVSPGNIELYIADPSVAADVLKRSRNDFVKNPTTYGVLEIFGPSVNSVNGRTWERHRRITAPPFNERVSGRVWDASGRQVRGAKEAWGEGRVVRRTQEGCTRIALHVLTAAGFGMECAFEGGEDAKLDRGHGMSYLDAIRAILKNMGMVILVRIVQRTGWPNWATWGVVRETIATKDELGRYLSEMVQMEREKMRCGEGQRDNLMSVLVRSAERAKEAGDRDASLGMTDEEVHGNMFIWNVAGHDTTANTMAFALHLLAIDPQWQAWVAEEVDQVMGTDGEQEPSYEDGFPRLTRCLAVMYETLRLFGPVPALPRWTASSAQTLTIAGRPLTIPPNSDIVVNFAALHVHPAFWGPDAETFRPDRWVVSARDPAAAPAAGTSTGRKEKEKEQATVLDEDRQYDWQSAALLQPPPGLFVPWNDGPRVCPGKKFSQVEFVRVLAGLLAGRWRVELVREGEETADDVRRRASRMVRAARVDFALKMQGSDKVGLRWSCTDG